MFYLINLPVANPMLSAEELFGLGVGEGPGVGLGVGLGPGVGPGVGLGGWGPMQL